MEDSYIYFIWMCFSFYASILKHIKTSSNESITSSFYLICVLETRNHLVKREPFNCKHLLNCNLYADKQKFEKYLTKI